MLPVLVRVSQVAPIVKNLPAILEVWVQCLHQVDSLEKRIATHSRFFPGKSHGQRSVAGYSPWGLQKS